MRTEAVLRLVSRPLRMRRVVGWSPQEIKRGHIEELARKIPAVPAGEAVILRGTVPAPVPLTHKAVMFPTMLVGTLFSGEASHLAPP